MNSQRLYGARQYGDEVYYAHPYRSSERGTNESLQQMVRRDFPKGESLDAVSPLAVAATEAKLSHLPRHGNWATIPLKRSSSPSVPRPAPGRQGDHGWLKSSLSSDNMSSLGVMSQAANLFLQFAVF